MNKIIKYCKELVQTNASPASIALGFAMGTFIAILPTPGFGIFIGLFLAIIFKRINKIGLIAAFSIWNPLLLLPTYWVCYLLGDLIFQPDPMLKFDIEIVNQIYHYSGKFLIGNFFIALTVAALSYYLVFYIVSLHRERKSWKGIFNFFWINQFNKAK